MLEKWTPGWPRRLPRTIAPALPVKFMFFISPYRSAWRGSECPPRRRTAVLDCDEMQFLLPSGIRAALVAVLAAALSFAQDAPIREAKRIPPRATPADYQAHAQAGTVTVAAEFTGHSVSTPEAILNSEDYVVVEVALFGPPDARLRLSYEDFSLRINGKKVALPAQPFGMVFKSLKDPEWVPPVQADSNKSKTTIGNSGRNQTEPGAPPPIVHIPIEVERVMQLRVQKAALPEGERPLPEAGLIFFQHHGKIDAIHSIELLYAGAAGKATLNLQP
jgi:hypothetical protein